MNKNMNNEQKLINPMNEIMKREPEYEDFVTREEFINRTGIMVSPTYFSSIVYGDFKESGLSVDEFISTYEEDFYGEIVELPLSGTLKYNISDDLISLVGLLEDELSEPNIYEIINGLLLFEYGEHEQKVKLTEKYIRDLEKVSRILDNYRNTLNMPVSEMTS